MGHVGKKLRRESVDGGEILCKLELVRSIDGKIAVDMNLLGVLWEAVVDDGIIVFNSIGHGRGWRGEVSVKLGRTWKVGRRVAVILVRRRHCRGGGKGRLLLLLLLVINVNQAVVEMVVGVVVDLGGDDCTHERWVVWHTRQGAPATRGPRWGESSIKKSNKRDEGTLVGEEHLQSWRHKGVDGSRVPCVDPYPARSRHVEWNSKHSFYK